MIKKKFLRINPETGDIQVVSVKGPVTTQISFNPTDLEAGAEVTIQVDLPDKRVVFVGNAPFKKAEAKTQ